MQQLAFVIKYIPTSPINQVSSEALFDPSTIPLLLLSISFSSIVFVSSKDINDFLQYATPRFLKRCRPEANIRTTAHWLYLLSYSVSNLLGPSSPLPLPLNSKQETVSLVGELAATPSMSQLKRVHSISSRQPGPSPERPVWLPQLQCPMAVFFFAVSSKMERLY